jgi:hypothetical protein
MTKTGACFQQHDFMLRSNWELVEIFRLLNGANHMEMETGSDYIKELMHPLKKWSLSNMEIFRDQQCEADFSIR